MDSSVRWVALIDGHVDHPCVLWWVNYVCLLQCFKRRKLVFRRFTFTKVSMQGDLDLPVQCVTLIDRHVDPYVLLWLVGGLDEPLSFA